MPPISSPLPDNPQWLERPTAQDYQLARPKQAEAQKVAGVAILFCGITADGHLDPCKAEEETPTGMGFGDAAVALAPKFRMAATTAAGETVGGHYYRLRIRFTLPLPVLPDGVRLIGHPTWTSQPGGQQSSTYYPDRALRMGQGGNALIQCVVVEGGRLDACTVLDEDPPEFGFGHALLKLAPFFQMAPVDADGQPVVGGVVRVPMSFRPGA